MTPPPPEDDADVLRFLADLGLPGIVDVHVHFLPESVLRKVWAYFDRAHEHYGRAWPVHYRLPEPDRVAALAALGVTRFAPLVYPHRPGMARWLTEWVTGFAVPQRRRPANPETGRRRLSRNQREVNSAHARQRGPGERANASLKSWKVLRKIRCCPLRATSLVKAVLVLILAG